MDFAATARLSADPADVLRAVADLATYPRWLGIVAAAEPTAAHPDDGGPAWQVTLQARLGPLVRRKRLRMVRTVREPDEGWVRFERLEHDGRAHGAWVLTAGARPLLPPSGWADSRSQDDERSTHPGQRPGCELEVGLAYDGVGWIPGLDLLLRQEAGKAGRRLDALLAQR